ncbi:hypothetical protein EJ06DRAFT_494666 [Trichodelitschia bisporula]|uniref:Carboxymuconolactone decarboxylase-like domain-containing protein n=1 Tax=Trichodelitschia bisporula TaxID=703511 RepID=A0A6G1HV58_9PEZI|nr:hypothetical protein EJ06DRAFT_494666 [Trichodelitschia bisporula]
MRLPYVPNPPPNPTPDDEAIINRVVARRGARGLTPLDLTLLHSPPVTDGWNTFLGAIRTRTTLTPTVRETAICRIASLNRAWYEWEHHAPLLTAAGTSEAGLAYILSSPTQGHEPSEEAAKAGMDETLLAVLAYTDTMTANVAVREGEMQRLRAALQDERAVVELTATVAAYNAVSRFLVALDVGERNGEEGRREAMRRTGEGLVDVVPWEIYTPEG